MTESWLDKHRRECRQMDALVESLMGAGLSGAPLRARVEQVAQQPRFADFCWRWGPWLARQDAVLFRPLLLSNFSSVAVDAKGNGLNPWKGEAREPLEAWLAQVDAADDIELTRRLFHWRAEHLGTREKTLAHWSSELLRRVQGAPPARVRIELAKLKGPQLDVKTALGLYRADSASTRDFILDSLPWFGPWGDRQEPWAALLDASVSDTEFHFALYRRVVTPKRWAADVRALADDSSNGATLDDALERRHPRDVIDSAGEVFLDLLQKRRHEAVAYVQRHAGTIVPRWYAREAKGLAELVAFAYQNDWLELWGALLRTGGSAKLFDAEVKRLVGSSDESLKVRTLLQRIAGPGREANYAGLSVAQVHPLSDDTALALYQAMPELLRGPFRLHVAPGWHSAYPKTVAAVVAAGDDEVIDFFASRFAMQPNQQREWLAVSKALAAHYEALHEAEFVSRAASALSRVPAFAIWNVRYLLEHNALARLFFERSTELYLGNAAAVRDLLESPQIHVQALAFRILGQNDPRAPALAAANIDLLQASLLRPLHRRTRLLAFDALRRAASHDEATARVVADRARDACALPDRRYPKEALIGLVADVLHRWPALRGETEQRRVFGGAAA